MDRISADALARIETLEQGNAFNGLGVQRALAAFRNRAYGEGAATTAGQATITTVAAAKLIAKTSGVFFGWAVISYASATAADVVTYTMKSFNDAVAGTPLTLGNAGQIGFGANGIALPGNVAVTNNGAFTSTAGAGITLTGATAGQTLFIETNTIGTAAAGDKFSWFNVASLGAYGATESPFPLGTTCCITLSLTNSVAARATGNIVIGLVELP